MTKQDSGFKGRMDDFGFEVVSKGTEKTRKQPPEKNLLSLWHLTTGGDRPSGVRNGE